MEITWQSFFSFIIIPVIAQKQDGEQFWRHVRTTHKPLYGSPEVAEWYQDSSDTDSDQYYNYYGGADNFENHNQVVRNQENEDSKPESGSIQNDSPFGFNDVENKDLNAEEALPYSHDGPLNQGSNFDGYSSNKVHQLDLERCTDKPNVKYYCRKLKDGLYFDPWNPWCGYIRCDEQLAVRQVCNTGTWMGLNNAIKYTGKEMCRRRLPKSITIGDDNACPESTDYELCKNAQTIELEQESS